MHFLNLNILQDKVTDYTATAKPGEQIFFMPTCFIFIVQQVLLGLANIQIHCHGHFNVPSVRTSPGVVQAQRKA